MEKLINFLKKIAHSTVACLAGALLSAFMWHIAIIIVDVIIYETLLLFNIPSLINTCGTSCIAIEYAVLLFATIGIVYLSYHLSKYVILTSMDKLYEELEKENK